MFAVVVRVELPESHTIEQGRKILDTYVVPEVKQSPGFVAGYWMHPLSGRVGLSCVIYDDEQSARAAAANVKAPEPVKLLDVEVREVVASA